MSTADANMVVLTRAQVREVDRRSMEDFGIAGIVLMENAGRNAAALIAGWVGPVGRVSIVCGSGNNGGDGFVIARYLSNVGFDVRVYTLCDVSKLRGDAQVNYRIVERMGLSLHFFRDAESISGLAELLRPADLIVDALLGTGFSGTPRFPIDAAIQAVNAAGPRVVAIDVPSGMDCDTGLAAGPCVRAWRTITFVAMKPGFLVPGAEAATGEVFVADIGAPAGLIAEIASVMTDRV